MALAIRIILAALATGFLYVTWVVVSLTRYHIKRGPHFASGLGVLHAFALNTAISPWFIGTAVAVVVLAIKA